MSDLYNSEKYTFDELCKKYENFAAPLYKIIVADKNISDEMGYYTDNITVMQTIKAKSGSCRFSIVGAYDLKESGFKSGFDSSFPLGAKVEVFLGYKKPVLVFKGFIGDVSFSFGEDSTPKATVSCFDVRTLMMHGRQNNSQDKTKFETVAEQIFSYYKSFITFENNCKQKHNKEENFNQNCSDFDYINNYARTRGNDFFVLGDKAYLQEIHAEKDPLITLEWGKSILSFSYNHSYNAVNVEGALANYTDGRSVAESIKDAKPAYKQVQLTNNPVVFRLDMFEVESAENLKAVEGSETKKWERESKSGTVRCIGLPELIPGRFITLAKMDKSFLDNKLFVSEVTHEFSTSGYTTTLDFSCADGDANKPNVLGGLYNNQINPPADLNDEENNKICIQTKSGHSVQFMDTKDNTLIEVVTAGKLCIKLDDEAKTLTLSDSKGDNKITINEKDGEISIAAKNKISFKAGSAVLTLDGQGKAAEINAETVAIKPSQTLSLGGNQMKIEGQQIQIKGQTVAVEGTQLELKSSGVASLKGAMVKIN